MQAHRSNERRTKRYPQKTRPIFALLLLCLTTAGIAQATQNPQQPDQTKPPEQSSSPADNKPDDKTAQAPQPPAAPLTPEEARQAQLVADTNKLLQLAEELKTEVAKSNKDTLSLSVIKKAAEVEKLARSLKERMKTQ